MNPRTNTHLVERECDNGVCLKWTKYDKGQYPHFGTESINACPFVEAYVCAWPGWLNLFKAA